MNELEQRTIEVNESVKIAEFLLGMQIPFQQQIGRNRYCNIANVANGKDTTIAVNLDRNHWYSEELEMGGKVTELVEDVMNQGKIDFAMLKFIEEQASKARKLEVRSTFDFQETKVTVKVKVKPLQDPMLLSHLCAFGISADISTKYLMQGTFRGIKDGKEHHTVVFGNDKGGYYLFNGGDFRTYGTDGITIIGEPCKGQRLCVYDNVMDFLAMMQKRSTLGTDVLLSNDRHLVINGSRNLEDALNHIKEKSDYENICCIFPTNDYGKKLFAKISNISAGAAIDSSRLYAGYLTLADTLVGRLRDDSWSQDKKKSDMREIQIQPVLQTERATSKKVSEDETKRKGRTVDVVIPRKNAGMKL